MRAKLSPLLAVPLFFSWLLSGCAPAATRGYRLEPAAQTVWVPLFVNAIAREDQSQTIYIWPAGYGEIEGDQLMNFSLRTKGYGSGDKFIKYQLAMDTGDCDHPVKVDPVRVWLLPSQAAKIAQLKQEMEGIHSTPPPEAHWTEKVFETFAPPKYAQASKADREKDVKDFEAKAASEIGSRADRIERLESLEAELSKYPEPSNASSFKGTLRFPWNPRACNLEILFHGRDSTHHFPFRQVRPR